MLKSKGKGPHVAGLQNKIIVRSGKMACEVGNYASVTRSSENCMSMSVLMERHASPHPAIFQTIAHDANVTLGTVPPEILVQFGNLEFYVHPPAMTARLTNVQEDERDKHLLLKQRSFSGIIRTRQAKGYFTTHETARRKPCSFMISVLRSGKTLIVMVSFLCACG